MPKLREALAKKTQQYRADEDVDYDFISESEARIKQSSAKNTEPDVSSEQAKDEQHAKQTKEKPTQKAKRKGASRAAASKPAVKQSYNDKKSAAATKSTVEQASENKDSSAPEVNSSQPPKEHLPLPEELSKDVDHLLKIDPKELRLLDFLIEANLNLREIRLLSHFLKVLKGELNRPISASLRELESETGLEKISPTIQTLVDKGFLRKDRKKGATQNTYAVLPTSFESLKNIDYQ